jgi:hypothetical protein
VPTNQSLMTRSLWPRFVLLAGLAGLIAACGADGDDTAGASATSTAEPPVATSTPTLSQPQDTPISSAPSSDVRVVKVKVSQGKVQTANDRVELARGEAARLVVTSDIADECTYTAASGLCRNARRRADDARRHVR